MWPRRTQAYYPGRTSATKKNRFYDPTPDDADELFPDAFRLPAEVAFDGPECRWLDAPDLPATPELTLADDDAFDLGCVDDVAAAVDGLLLPVSLVVGADEAAALVITAAGDVKKPFIFVARGATTN